MNCKFEVEIERDKPEKIFEVLRLVDELYSNDQYGYYFKKDGNCNQKDWLQLNTMLLSSGDLNVYPLDAILPLIKFRITQLPKADTKEFDVFSDVNFIHTFTVSVNGHGINIKPTFIPIGK